MSEYQYYEFLAVDRPLDEQQQAEARALSTRATVTATSFVNEYHWGDFKGDPSGMVEYYYDAHLYLADWGTRRIMLRLPSSALDIDVAKDYCVGEQVTVWPTREFVVLDLTIEDEPDDDWYDPEGALPVIVGVRAELAAGDLRPLYLAWLAGYGTWERDEDAFDREADDELEPPVPPGLTTLTAPQRALADFLRLDGDLLAMAARTSPPRDETTDSAGRLAAWVAELPPAEKDRLLVRVVEDQAAAVRLELLGRYRRRHITRLPDSPRRTVGDLLDGAARLRADRERREEAEQRPGS